MFTPQLSPFNGGFQLEWNYGDDYLEIEFKETNINTYMILDGAEILYDNCSSETMLTLMQTFFTSMRKKGFKDDTYP